MAMEPVPSGDQEDPDGSDADPIESGRGRRAAVRQIVTAVDQDNARPPRSRAAVTRPVGIRPPSPRLGDAVGAEPALTHQLDSAIDGSPRSYQGGGRTKIGRASGRER